nr:immunoglobulin light chain junction region [Macaca mulatta]MOV60948.1 immunoglobulin light chain junction region [Macaca mulatta]MOV62095.1 immunoglobulin light chain junction region [Macaca mulatta]MOV65118.1 immunoglobulin light chain junction region [Macaca mulatta]MOV65317.1 immunoglobulin light chain junction region [Macaca mulatta]
CMQGLEFPPTF